jgi:hypothetical protein
MFIIFGWNHKISKYFGPVLPQKCQHCNNEEFWHLYKISKWFTLFFIPIFQYESQSLLVCPICKNSMQIDKEIFDKYKPMAKINTAFCKNEIGEEQRIKQLNSLSKLVEIDEKENALKYAEESKRFIKQVKGKTDKELTDILNQNRDDYNPAFLVAVQNEI